MSESVKEAGITMPIEMKQKSGYRKWRVEDKKKTRKHRFAMGPVGPRNPAANLFRMARPKYNESGYWHPSAKGDEYIALYKKAMATGEYPRSWKWSRTSIRSAPSVSVKAQ